MTPSVGLVHDYLLVMRGAERTFEAITRAWPQAVLYTTVYSEGGTERRFAGRRVISSPLQRLPVDQDNFRRLLPLYPWAVGRLPVGEHDVIVSSSSAFAHGVRPRPDAVHVCYCYTPFRYAWHERETALAEVARPLRPAVTAVLDRVKRWDIRASERVTRYVAISRISKERIERAYGRDAAIVHPPVELDRFSPDQAEDYFLTVGEVVRHKRIEVVLEACRRARAQIKIVGTGPDLHRLAIQYEGTAEFLGRVPDDALPPLYRGARALLMPNIEEFGITAVEAQASGRPVVATDAGGAQETVLNEVTGLLIPGGGTDAFAEAIRETDFDRFDSADAVRQAHRFSTERFQEAIAAQVARAVSGG